MLSEREQVIAERYAEGLFHLRLDRNHALRTQPDQHRASGRKPPRGRCARLKVVPPLTRQELSV